MQTVGVQWLLVHQPHASILVVLVQTAITVSVVLLAYVGGILAADLFSTNFRNNGKTVGPDGPKRNVADRLAGNPVSLLRKREKRSVG